jgi:hypothetical protein
MPWSMNAQGKRSVSSFSLYLYIQKFVVEVGILQGNGPAHVGLADDEEEDFSKPAIADGEEGLVTLLPPVSYFTVALNPLHSQNQGSTAEY